MTVLTVHSIHRREQTSSLPHVFLARDKRPLLHKGLSSLKFNDSPFGIKDSPSKQGWGRQKALRPLELWLFRLLVELYTPFQPAPQSTNCGQEGLHLHHFALSRTLGTMSKGSTAIYWGHPGMQPYKLRGQLEISNYNNLFTGWSRLNMVFRLLNIY